PDRSYRCDLSPQGSRGFYVRAEHASLPPHASDMLTPRPGNWWCGDLHPTRFTALSAAPAQRRFCANYGISPERRTHDHFLRRCGLAINKCPPVRNRAEGHHCYRQLSQERFRYCLSYTVVLLNFLPCGSVPLVVTVRVLPSADTTTRPVIVTSPVFLTVNSNVRSSICLYDRESEFGSPVTG